MNADRILLGLTRRYVVAPSGCWEWTGYRSDCHYGIYTGGQKTGWPVNAHRLMYMVKVGPIPDGFHIDHLCRNRGCINPQHLQAVTPRVNTLRGMGPSGMNARKTHCPAGHSYANAARVDSNGRRVCRVCQNARSRDYFNRVHKAPPKPPRTHCANGHEQSVENVRYVNGDPKQPQCRACQRVRSGAYKARKRAERQAAAA